MRTIRSSLSIWLSIIILIIGVFSGLLYYNWTISMAHQRYDLYITGEAESLAHDLAVLLWNFDEEAIKHLCEQRMRAPDYKGIELVDDQNISVFSKRLKTSKETINFKRNIIYQDEKIGEVTILFEEPPYDDIKRGILGATGFILAGVVIAAWLAIQLLLSRFLSSPMLKLGEAIGNLSAGDYDQSIKMKSKREIQKIMEGVNLLSAKLVERDREIKEYTNELKEKNDALTEEIEEHEKSVEALRKSEERYKALFDNNPVETIVVDQEGKITGYNQAKERSGGGVPNKGEIMYREFASKHKPEMHEELIDCIKSGVFKRFDEIKYKEKYLSISFAPFSGGAIITSIDLSTIKIAQAALEESERRLRLVADGLPFLIGYIDYEERYLFANRNYEEWFGVPASDIIGMKVQELLGPKGYQSVKEHVQVALSGQLASYEGKRISLDKRIVYFHGRMIPNINKDGNISGFFSFIEDITPRKKAEEEKKTLELQLRQAQKMESIGNLAGGIAHDFNNILSPLMIHTEMVMMDLPEESPLQHNLQQIYLAGERARDLVKQILTFSRKKEEKLTSIRVIPIINEVLKMLRSSIPATINIDKNIETERDIVLADPTQIHQILMNLCTNSSHAMKENGGTLRIILTDEELDTQNITHYSDLEPGKYLKLVVQDNGTGMDEKTIQNIFEPYFTTKKTGEGTGLGLAVVHGIVKSYGGDIRVQSKAGKGTTFYILLPRYESDVLQETKEVDQLPRGNERILFVDDEKDAVDAMTLMLESFGYSVTARTSSIDALEAFRAKPDAFDLVITDMTMPNMTGKDLATEMFAIRRDIPIILCTGFSEQIDETLAKAMGIKAYVMKPIVISELSRIIRDVLDKADLSCGAMQ